jgi:aspartyl-tRNA(Asn)/glutamyl-tRNA(Gln) amidotransferase subunit B
VNLHLDVDGKTVATPIVEIKNLNSFRSVERAIKFEAERQLKLWKETGKTIKDAPKTTRGWDEADGVTKPQREKETAADYRYFPEPDLVPVEVDEAWLERVRSSIGELPADRRSRFETEYGLSPYDANVLVEQGEEVADYYDAVARATGEYKLASNWVQQDVLRTAKEKKLTLDEFPVKPEALADLINRVKRKEVNTNQGREALARMIETGDPVEKVIAEGGYGMVSDRSAIAEAIEKALEANPKAVEDLRGGKKKPEAVKGFLRGQVMKQTGGKADPAVVGELLDARLAELG